MALRVEVQMDEAASPEEVEAVEKVLREHGFEGPVEARIGRKSLGELPFVIYISAPAIAFLTAFATAAGKDAYHSVKRFVRDVVAARRDRRGSIVVDDRGPDSDHTVLVLSSDLPDEAFVELIDLDLDELKGAYLVWEGGRGWHDPMRGKRD